MNGPEPGDFYLTPGSFWRGVLLLLCTGAAIAYGVLVTWMAFPVAAALFVVALGLDVTIFAGSGGEKRGER